MAVTTVARNRYLELGASVALGLAVACGVLFGGALYAAAGLAGIAGVLLAARSRHLVLAGFVGVAALLPYAVIPVSIGGVRLTLVDVLLSALLLSVFAGLLLRIETRRGTPIDWMVAAFVVVSGAAFILGTAYGITGEQTRQFLKLVNSTLLFFTLTQFVRERHEIDRLTRLIASAGVVAALLGVILYHLPPAVSNSLLVSLRPLGYPSGNVLRYIEDAGVRTDVLRATGTSVDPNVFGALLIVIGTLATGHAIRAAGRAAIAWYLGAAVVVYALLVSLSRGSWLGFGIGSLAVVILLRPRLLWWLGGGVVVTMVAFAGIIARFGEHFLRGLFVQDQATGMRLGEYKDALRLIQEHPFLGIGFGGAPSIDRYLGVSSTFLLIASEVGLVGLGLFLGVIGFTLMRVRIALRHQRGDDRARTTVLACTLAGMLVAGGLDRHFYDLRFPHMAALLWLVIGLVHISIGIQRADAYRGGREVEGEGAANPGQEGRAGADSRPHLASDGHPG